MSYPELRDPDQIPDPLETIWENWRSGEGRCEGCQNRDCEGYWKPSYAGGSIPSEVAIVAETPNQGWRFVKDSPESGEEYKTREDHDYWGVANPTWSMFTQFIRPVIDDNVSGYDRNSIYYTNAKKCGDIEVGDVDSEETRSIKQNMNSEAMESCKQYLSEELAVVDPNVIIAFPQSVSEVNEVYNRIPDTKLKNIALTICGDESPFIIPSYHWSGLRFNYDHPESFSLNGKHGYWEALGDQIETALTRADQ